MPGVPWIAEMLGYVLASCELGFQHQIWPELQLVPGVNWTTLGSPPPPVIHYHTPVWINHHKWVKYVRGIDLFDWHSPARCAHSRQTPPPIFRGQSTST